MIEPSINKMMEKFDSKYTLVITAAKRARQIEEGVPLLTRCPSEKPVTIAAYEIYDGKITYSRNKKEQ